MDRIFIVGGDGFARECYAHIQSVMQKDNNMYFGGFVGHNGYRVDFGALNKFFVGDLSEITFDKNDKCIIGAGYPHLRKIIYEDLKKKGAKLCNLIVGDGQLNEYVELGEGNILNHSFPSPYVKIGNGNLFNFQVIIAHDVTVGDFNFVGPRSQLLGGVRIGDNNTIATNAVLLPKSKIGNNNKIAPLSVLYKGCRNHCYIQGNPAVKVGVVEE